MSERSFFHRDIAISNLRCAVGLPRMLNLDVPALTRVVDRWASAVDRYARASQHLYDRDPFAYQNHEGVFRFIAMATFLKHPGSVGIQYSPRAVGNYDFSDARDDFLFGPVTRRLATCLSFPVLFAAIGRRLGYPMYLALAYSHVICQWVDDVSRVNLEGACPGGGNAHPDEYYQRTYAGRVPPDIDHGRFLRPLDENETLSLFLEARGHCFADNGRLAEARASYETALEVAPDFSVGRIHLNRLETMVP